MYNKFGVENLQFIDKIVLTVQQKVNMHVFIKTKIIEPGKFSSTFIVYCQRVSLSLMELAGQEGEKIKKKKKSGAHHAFRQF